jgi:enterobacterial common antigen flippase
VSSGIPLTVNHAVDQGMAAAAVPPPPSLRSRTLGLLVGARPLAALFQAMSTQVIVIGINILTGVLTARALGPDGRGAFAAITTWPQLLATLATAGLNSAVIFRMRKAPEKSGAVAAAALLLSGTMSIVAIGVGVLLMPIWMARYPPAIVTFSQLCLASVVINSSQMMIKQGFAGAGRFGQFNLSQLLPQLLYLIGLVALIALGAMTVQTAVLALLGGGAVAFLVTLVPFVRQVRPRLRPGFSELKPVVSYSARAMLMDAVFVVATYADRIVLIPLLPIRELGLYAVAFSFSRVIQLSQPAITSVVFSHMAKAKEADSRVLHDRALRMLLVGLVVGCAVLWFAGAPLLRLAYGAEFTAANTIFRLLVIEASLGALSQVTAQLYLSHNRPGFVSTIQVCVLGATLAALLLLVPAYGAKGAAIALLAAGTVRWLCLLGGVSWVLGQRLPGLLLTRADLNYVIGKIR